MYNDTVTIFNGYDSSLGFMWYPTVIEGVNVVMDKAAIVSKYGAESKDNVIIGIKYNLVDGQIMIGDKKWLPPKEWENQTNDMLPKTITFASGEQPSDFIYVGKWEGETPIDDADLQYGRGGFLNYMSKNYDYVFSITGEAHYSVIPHFEVRGA